MARFGGDGPSGRRLLRAGSPKIAPSARTSPSAFDPVPSDIYSDTDGDELGPTIRPTLTLPSVSLPSTPSTPGSLSGAPQSRNSNPSLSLDGAWGEQDARDDWYEGADLADDENEIENDVRPTFARSRAATQAQPLASRTSGKQRAVVPLDEPFPARSGKRSVQPRQPKPSRALATLHKVSDALGETVFIPGRKARTQLPPAIRTRVNAAAGVSAVFLKKHRMFLLALVLLTVLTSVVANAVGVGPDVGVWSASAWRSLSGITVAPPPPAPDPLDPAHYVTKYGFDWPHNTLAIPSDERQRLITMLPFALQATAAYDFRYSRTIEPEMILWWTHAEGIQGRINYSNCANQFPRPGASYFTDIENCSESSFWQLGYGNQFSVIYVLKNAFRDLHGNPEDPRLVQRVGQAVLDYDASQGTIPRCGGYSCAFPALTIDQIMAGVNETTGVETADNWWASVLSRDPAINCYMIAHALTYFNHAATKRWVGCYYEEPCWGYESDRLGDILAAWPGLRRAAGV